MPLKVIVFSSLFPSPQNPIKGLFVSELTDALSRMTDISVLAPVIAHRNFKQLLRIPRNYLLSNRIKVWAPVVFNFPKILKSTDGALMAACSRSAFTRILHILMRLPR
jgi:hypothetical protein